MDAFWAFAFGSSCLIFYAMQRWSISIKEESLKQDKEFYDKLIRLIKEESK